MNKPTLYVMVGLPGSGKTTWAKKNLKNAVYISRDEIRYSLLKDSEDYFSKETEVYSTFINKIKENLLKGKNVIADATHINRASRRKLINSIRGVPAYLEAIWIDVPLERALKQNENRPGRALVPQHAITSMKTRFENPKKIEGFKEIRRITNDLL